MAKRMCDTDKWKKPWFRKLKPVHKVFWQYILDNCDHAGVWEVDFELAGDLIGAKLNPIDLAAAFVKQVHPFDEGRRWFILDFIEFQYGQLGTTSNVHKSVVKTLKNRRIYELYLSLTKPLGNPSPTLDEPLGNPWSRGKDKDQAKEKAKEDGGSGEGTIPADVIAYLNLKAGKSFSPKSEATLKLIRGRLADGATLEDFKYVIDVKCADWLTDARMEPYLRPDTLFRPSNFESYRNQKNAGGSHGKTGSNGGPGGLGTVAQRNAQAVREANEQLEEELRLAGRGHPQADTGLLHLDGPGNSAP